MKFEMDGMGPAPSPGVPITVSGEPLHLTVTPKQQEIFSDPHRFVVFPKGRRCGGTYGAVIHCIELMIEGKNILWVDTIQLNLSKYFRIYFSPILRQIKKEYWEWNEQKKTLTILNGSISMVSAQKPENIEGFAYDLIIINEAGIVFKNNAYLWYNSIYPMVMDFQAPVLFIGTPKGKLCKDGSENLFYTFYKKGLDPISNPDWVTHVASSYENPKLKRSEIQAYEAGVPPSIRRQEIWAEFIDIGSDELFKSEWHQIIDLPPAEYTIRRKILSLDTAFKDNESSDYSAWTMWCQTTEKFICYDAGMDHLNFPDLIKKTQELYDRWHPDVVVIEDKASGQSLIQMFQRTSMPVIPFKIDRDKLSRAVAVTPLIEQGKVQMLRGAWNALLINQLSLFPSGEFDDLCFSGDTLIATPKGDKPIASLKIGDSVITPIGIKKIVKTFCHLGKTINKLGLTCTENHPIFANGSFIPINALTQASSLDILTSWTLIKWYLKFALNSRGNSIKNLIGKPLIITVAHTTLLLRPKVIKHLMLYIKSYGKNIITGQFLRDLKFIIKTIIGIITTLIIYNYYHFNNIMRSIKINLVQKINWNTLKILDPLHLNGTGAPKGELGTAFMPQENWKKETNTPACTAEMRFYQITPVENSVAITVISNGDISIILKWLQSCVLNVIKILKRKTVEKEQTISALDPVQSDPQNIKVYNLEISQAHCYYANKILVGNCDSYTQGLLYLSGGMGNFNNDIRPVITKSIIQDVIQEESVAFLGSGGIRHKQRENVLTGYWK